MPDRSAGLIARWFRKLGVAKGKAVPPVPPPLDARDGNPADGVPADGVPEVDAASAGTLSDAPAAAAGESPSAQPEASAAAGRIVTVVSLEAHAGLATLCAALEYRLEDQDMQVRGAGPGLMRAAFGGMLSGTDILILLAPAEAAATGSFHEKLDWLVANDRAALVERTIFVVNYGTTQDGGALELPASLPRPVVMLPFDEALSLPAQPRRAPRRAARHALDQLVAEIKTIPGEH